MTHSPPNSCMPSKANIKINKNSKNKRLIIDLIELSNDMTKFRNEFQYLLSLYFIVVL
jgi:hypothetical protein